MPKKFFKSISPKPEKIHNSKLLKIFGDVLHSHALWHLHRNTISTAFFVGIFCAFLPLPGQMFIAAALAMLLRCHLPMATLLVWITNPVTMPAIFYGNYLLGAFLLGSPGIELSGPLNLGTLQEKFSLIWQPLLLGSVVAGLFFGSLSYGLVRVLWRILVIRQWFNRKKNR